MFVFLVKGCIGSRARGVGVVGVVGEDLYVGGRNIRLKVRSFSCRCCVVR